MPVITQGRKQFIVTVDTLFGWKKYNKKYPNSTILKLWDRNKLEVVGPNRLDYIEGRKW